MVHSLQLVREKGPEAAFKYCADKKKLARSKQRVLEWLQKPGDGRYGSFTFVWILNVSVNLTHFFFLRRHRVDGGKHWKYCLPELRAVPG